MEVREILLARVDDLIETLLGPLPAQEATHGWTTSSQSAILSFLNDLRVKLAAEETLPYLGIVRALDYWGITGGDLLQKAAEIDYGLRHMKD